MGRRRNDRRRSATGRRAHRSRRRPHTRVLASVLTIGMATVGGLQVARQNAEHAENTERAENAAGSGSTAPSTDAPTPPSSSPSSPSSSPSASPSDSTSPSAEVTEPEEPEAIPVPATGPGTFVTARADGTAVGSGTIRTYRVQVEDGIRLSATEAAREIAAILGHPRGWTNDGVNGFRLVSGGPSDFVIKIATPGTADALCGAAGLNTHGELNCAVGGTVVVNLKRWVLGSPEFAGPVSEYRALIVNHEVGHRIGHGHETCPGPGLPAPAMMQQIKGLKGCVSNAWPYSADGTYLGGPSVP